MSNITYYFMDDGSGTPDPKAYKIAGLIMHGYADGDVTLGDIHTFESIDDAIALGITAAYDANAGSSPAYPVLAYRQISEFFRVNELYGGGGKLNVLLLANTVTLTQALDKTNVNYAKNLLKMLDGEITFLGAVPNHADDYAPTYLNGIDADVSGTSGAIVKAQQLVEEELSEGRNLRCIVIGCAASSAAAASAYLDTTLKDSECVTVFLGNDNDVATSGPDQYVNYVDIGAYLGLLSSRNVNVSPGYVLTGNVRDVASGLYINPGFSSGELITDKPASFWATLESKGYGFFTTVKTKSGKKVVVNQSATCTLVTSDYSSIENNRVVGKIADVTQAAIADSINGPVKVKAGKLMPDMVATLEDIVNDAIDPMRQADEFSGGRIVIDPNWNVATSKRIKFLVPIEATTTAKYFDFYINLVN